MSKAEKVCLILWVLIYVSLVACIASILANQYMIGFWSIIATGALYLALAVVDCIWEVGAIEKTIRIR